LSEVEKEVMFVKELYDAMGVGLKLPITVKIDSVGAS
jgi:hypothetical protein